MKNGMKVPLKTRVELLYDPAIQLLGVYLDKTLLQKDSCNPMFIAAQFTIVKTWKQMSIDRWMEKDMVHSYNGILCVLRVKSLQSTLCNPMDCSLPGSSVQGIFQVRIREWLAMPSSRGSSQPSDQTHITLHLLRWQVGSSPLAPKWNTT